MLMREALVSAAFAGGNKESCFVKKTRFRLSILAGRICVTAVITNEIKRMRIMAEGGITVCSRWDSFKNFLKDMGPRPSLLHSLERIDTNGNYEPGNCKWATRREQQNNTRTNVRLHFRGEEKTVAEWAKEAPVNESTFRTRLWQGWTLEQALQTARQTEKGKRVRW